MYWQTRIQSVKRHHSTEEAKGEEPSIFKHSEYVWPKAAQRLHKGINVNNFSADTTLSHNLQSRDGEPVPYKVPALHKKLLTNKKWY